MSKMAGTKRPIDAVDGKASKKPKTFKDGDKKSKSTPKKAADEEDFVQFDDKDATTTPVTKHAKAKPQKESDPSGKPDGDSFLNGMCCLHFTPPGGRAILGHFD